MEKTNLKRYLNNSEDESLQNLISPNNNNVSSSSNNDIDSNVLSNNNMQMMSLIRRVSLSNDSDSGSDNSNSSRSSSSNETTTTIIYETIDDIICRIENKELVCRYMVAYQIQQNKEKQKQLIEEDNDSHNSGELTKSCCSSSIDSIRMISPDGNFHVLKVH